MRQRLTYQQFVTRFYHRFAVLCLLTIAMTGVMVQAQQSDFERLTDELTESSLPIVNLQVDKSALSSNEYVEGTITIIDPHNGTNGDSVFSSCCLIKYHGSSSLQYTKKSFSIKLLYPADSLDRQRNVSLFGIRKEDHWLLDAMATDRLRMRNRVCFDIWNQLSRTPYSTKSDCRNGSEGVFVEVCMNDAYRGIYCLMDPVNRKLLNLDKQKEDQIGGVLYKGINWKQGSNLLTYNGLPKDTTIWGAWECKYPDSISAEGWTPLRKLIEFCRYRSDADFEMQYRDYFYRDNLIAYIVLVYALCIRDTGWKNCYLSQRRRGEGPFLLTVWDMDYSFGEMFNGDYDTTCVTYDKMSKTAPFNRLYVTDMDGFRSSVISLWQTCRTTMLHPDSINALMETYAESFVASGAWERERQRWDNKPVPLQPDIHDELAYVDSWYRKNYDTLSTLWAGKDVFTAVQRKTQDSPSSHSKTAYSLFGLPVRVDDLPAGTLYIEDSRLHFAR